MACEAHPDACAAIARNANRFVQAFCGRQQALRYARALVEAMVMNK